MKELMEIPGGDWERVDIGRMNLICARDADGANRIDVERLVKVLDEWAEIAKAAEERGTCLSFPVLLVALGRRLGYPLYLKTTLGHMFCCWDDGTERFNLDTNGDAVDTPPDEYYLTDPRFGLKGRSLDVLQRKRKMVNLANQEALGIFIETAGYSIEARGNSTLASIHYAIAMRVLHSPSGVHRLVARQESAK